MSAAQPTVFITVPKFVAMSPQYTKIRPAPSVSSNFSYASSSADEDMQVVAETTPHRGKKRRLDHLTLEEKIQRKKLKNRVAAQTSRDRKKARMEEMEYEIRTLTQTTQLLENKCESLQAINDSLLEKNQKLDMELEALRQQLIELQQKQQEYQQRHSNDEESSATKSAAVVTSVGWINQNGLTVDERTTTISTETIKKEKHTGSSVEDCGSVPALQDLLFLDDEEFDAEKLEEFAESLLADITADMETGDRTSNETIAENAGRTKRLLGSVVGTATERLESSEHSPRDGSLNARSPIEYFDKADEEDIIVDTSDVELKISKLDDESTSECPAKEIQNELQVPCNATNINRDDEVISANFKTAEFYDLMLKENKNQQLDTVYGTYDAKTNSITFTTDDDTVPVNEAVEEIYCEGDAPPRSVDSIRCPTPTPTSMTRAASPSQVFLSMDNSNSTTFGFDDMQQQPTNENYGLGEEDEDDLDFDPIVKFLRPKRPLISPLAKSPAPSLHSAISDHGYESITGSPDPPSLDHFATSNIITDDFTWNNSFNELFPNLV